MMGKRPRDSTGPTAVDELAEAGEKRAGTGHVVLNVGGMRFETTVDTLCSFSGSFFAKMFGGSYDTRTEPDGSYFIDRSGEHFGQVLNFMRTHRLALPPTQAGMVALQEELEYYQLTGPEYAQLTSLAATDYTRREVMDMRARGYTLFSGANLSGLNLARLDLEGCTMERCELRGTDLAKAKITNCDFTEANLDGANLSGCVFSESTDMSCASLRGANLSRVEFEQGSDLREDVDLTDAILDGASGSVRIGPGTKGIGELECNNNIPHEVFFACGQQSDVAKLGTVKIKDLWPDLDEGYEASDRVYLTFNDNPEGEEQPGYVDYGEFSGGDNPDRPTSRAKHKIRVGRDVRGGQIQWIGAAYE